ncbi:MAG: FimB/Mfa2 family fimbrial subunit, partial [Prevotella sp.]|nr:FimB/Mfa2 family fimbrial subunit [Prevotella sp.]
YFCIKFNIPMKITTKLMSFFTAVCCLSACEKVVIEEEDMAAPNSVLSVVTRADDGLKVSYPITVYVFEGQECQAIQTLGEEAEALNIPLVEGTYTVCAIGGAQASRYNLPTKEEATPTTPITLKEGMDHGDLMTAKSTVTLADGETNQLTLSMSRKVMQLTDITIKKIPKNVTAVSVTILPLWASLSIDGTYYQPGSSHVIELEQDDIPQTTWSSETQDYIMPPSDEGATIQVKLTTAEGSKTYAYNYSEKLEANYQLDIEGIYTEAIGVTLTGTLTGTNWAGKKTIKFDFDESGNTTGTPDNETPENGNANGGSEDNDNNNETNTFIVDNIPAANTAFMGCYVLSSKISSDANSAELLLLSPKQQEKVLTGEEDNGTKSSKINAAVSNCSEDGIENWRLMTLNEMNNILISNLSTIRTKLESMGQTAISIGECYIYNRNDTYALYYVTSSGNDNYGKYDKNSIVRPVATVTVKKR